MFKRYRPELLMLVLVLLAVLAGTVYSYLAFTLGNVYQALGASISVYTLLSIVCFLMYVALKLDHVVYLDPVVQRDALILYLLGVPGLIVNTFTYMLFERISFILVLATVIFCVLALTRLVLFTFKPMYRVEKSTNK